MTGKERVLSLLAGNPPDQLPCMPITMMFAADQLGCRYRDYAYDHRQLAAAQLLTAETFGFDYVSTISDPAREAADLGATVCEFDDQPPAMDEANALLEDKSRLVGLRQPDPLGGGRMHDRVLGVALLCEKSAGQLLVEGWVEGPCAEAADLRGINTLMLDFFDDPPFVHDLFAFNVEMALAFAKAQIAVGADLIGVGDAAASLVGPEIYREFVWPAEKRLVVGLHALGTKVRLHICGNTTDLLADMGRLGADIVDIDYLAPFDQAREKMGRRQALLGNIDPVRVLKNGTPEGVRAALATCHRQAGANYIVGAGCEIPRDTPLANVHVLAQFARHPVSA